MNILKLLNTLVASFVFCSPFQCNGFLTTHIPAVSKAQHKIGSKKKGALYAFYKDNNEGDNALAHNIQRTCIKQFLTQRSIQSFIFLTGECRDPHTADWIERFLGSPNLLEFHGTGAFNLTQWNSWDTVFLDMMKQPSQKIIIQARRRGRGRGGWSKNNPYLKDRFVEFEVSIDPPNIVSRIISVRSKIGQELQGDLDLVVAANDEILRSYKENVMDSRDGNTSSADITLGNKGLLMLRNNMAMNPLASSPLRKGTFDLLQLLVLHESVLRVLRMYKEIGEPKSVSFEWLREYFTESVEKYFDGNGPLNRADSFIEEMLLTPPSVKNTDNGMMELIDPLGITEDIISMRKEVATEWIAVLEDVQMEHSGLQKSLLSERWVQEPEIVQSELGAFE